MNAVIEAQVRRQPHQYFGFTSASVETSGKQTLWLARQLYGAAAASLAAKPLQLSVLRR